ncbi:MAG: homocysteine S-methyltransferase family protein, partial [Clostridia bacterium]|nr:homocysteine S-methyltransferase family protein [Clostridia bacterium]
MNFNEFLKSNIVILDGGMGTLLQEKGLMPGEHPERWNLTHPETIREIHKAYYDSGSNVISTNTFGANVLNFTEEELGNIITSAYENALWAKNHTTNKKEKFIALDIGPTGKLLKPLGDLEFEKAVDIFKKTIEIGEKLGVDLIYIETMNDSLETKAAVIAAKETTSLPIVVSNAYGEDGKLMTGATPEAMVALLEGMGVTALGANCSLGPNGLEKVIEKLLECASVPVLFKPNAGLPKEVDGKTLFDITPEEFSECVISLVKKGARLIGGCCGTTPTYISLLSQKSDNLLPLPIKKKDFTVVSSYTHAVYFDQEPILIGERINPTGKKRFKQALLEKDMDYILSEGIRQEEKGAHILDVNVGLPEIDETELLTKSVTELQAVLDLPLQIDSSSAEAMEKALRIYNGKALINSVNGKQESMEKIFPLAKKYGGVIIALTLDENGIPETSEGRIRIAKKIIATAEKYGIEKKNLIFDTLAMTVSADQKAAIHCLEALHAIKNDLGCHTSLGVSNISFGLPNRDVVNSIFFAMALENGLSAA